MAFSNFYTEINVSFIIFKCFKSSLKVKLYINKNKLFYNRIFSVEEYSNNIKINSNIEHKNKIKRKMAQKSFNVTSIKKKLK